MRIFALQTDRQKIIRRFCHDHEGESVVHFTHYHGLSFLFRTLKDVFYTIVLITLGVVAVLLNLHMGWTLGILGLVWFFFVFSNLLKIYIDWRYDFIVVTTDKVILVDQTLFFKQQIMPIHIENIGGISTFTQFWDIFPFGGMFIHLKEGLGGKDVIIKYVPNAQVMAGKISDVVTRYQRHNYQKELSARE